MFRSIFLVTSYVGVYFSMGFMYAHVFSGVHQVWWVGLLGAVMGATVAHPMLNAIKEWAVERDRIEQLRRDAVVETLRRAHVYITKASEDGTDGR